MCTHTQNLILQVYTAPAFDNDEMHIPAKTHWLSFDLQLLCTILQTFGTFLIE